ncbi:hypothetical protein [Desulfuromonas acetoxidans]|nr:hypothetical protein [Desulfuromonas acetoxidans]
MGNTMNKVGITMTFVSWSQADHLVIAIDNLKKIHLFPHGT